MFVDLHQCLNGSVSNLRVLITKQSNYWLNECFQRQRLCAIPKKKKKTKSIFQTIAALVYWEQSRLRCIAIVANMRLGLICFSCSYSQICDCSWCESRPRKSRIVFAHLRCKIYQLSSSFCFNKIQRREEKKNAIKYILLTHSMYWRLSAEILRALWHFCAWNMASIYRVVFVAIAPGFPSICAAPIGPFLVRYRDCRPIDRPHAATRSVCMHWNLDPNGQSIRWMIQALAGRSANCEEMKQIE